MSTSSCVVLVTAPSPAAAVELARTLVTERLVACGNVLPGVHSVYRWAGGVEEATEALLVLKTQQSRVPDVVARVTELHPYEVPEVIALPIEAGLAAYLGWIDESTTQQENA